MNALSVKQPWAHAIIFLGKPVENRDWRYPPAYRGPLIIHASKTFDKDGYLWICRNADLLGLSADDIPIQLAYPCGGIVGQVDLVDCVTSHRSPWFSGPLGFVLANAKPMKFIPYSGKLGIFNIPDEILIGGL